LPSAKASSELSASGKTSAGSPGGDATATSVGADCALAAAGKAQASTTSIGQKLRIGMREFLPRMLDRNLLASG
jgi:hypothetical protein